MCKNSKEACEQDGEQQPVNTLAGRGAAAADLQHRQEAASKREEKATHSANLLTFDPILRSATGRTLTRPAVTLSFVLFSHWISSALASGCTSESLALIVRTVNN